jgi:hypothetical protein
MLTTANCFEFHIASNMNINNKIVDLLTGQELTLTQYQHFNQQIVYPQVGDSNHHNGQTACLYRHFPDIKVTKFGADDWIVGEIMTYDQDGLITSCRLTCITEWGFDGMKVVFHGRSDFYQTPTTDVEAYSVEFDNGQLVSQ